jgi:hypothetical protein
MGGEIEVEENMTRRLMEDNRKGKEKIWFKIEYYSCSYCSSSQEDDYREDRRETELKIK